MSSLTSDTKVEYQVNIYNENFCERSVSENSFYEATETAEQLVREMIEQSDYKTYYYAKIETLIVPVYR